MAVVAFQFVPRIAATGLASRLISVNANRDMAVRYATLSVRRVNGAEIARWIVSARMGPHAIRLMASACVPEAGPECIAIKSVFLTATDRIVPKSAVAVTVGVAIIFLVNAIAPPVTQALYATIYVLWASMARNASRNAVVRTVDPAIL